jgi:hypothetical protein
MGVRSLRSEGYRHEAKREQGREEYMKVDTKKECKQINECEAGVCNKRKCEKRE